MLLEPHAKVIDRYHYQYDGVITSALLGDTLGQTILEHQHEAMKKWDLQPNELRYHSALSTQVLKAFRPLDSGDFKSIRGRTAPLPKIPAILNQGLQNAAHEVLGEVFKQSCWSAKIKEILLQSTFEPGDRRYRTDWKNGKPRLYGESTPRLDSLAFLIHELGHCLAESAHPGDSYREKILSEAYAQTVEELTVSYILREDLEGREEWRQYQRRIDQLNYHFYLWEISQHPEFQALSYLVENNCFDPSLLLFRETLFTATGYQGIYARASLLRAKVIASLSAPGL